MKSSFFSVFAILFIFITGNLFGNFGAIDGSSLKQPRTIQLTNSPDISLENERLSIHVENEDAWVEVTYLLTNNGNDQTIDASFPIEFIESEIFGDSDPIYQFKADEKVSDLYQPLNFTELKTVNSNINLQDKYGNALGQFTRWYNTRLSFKKNSSKEIKVNYKMRVSLMDGGISPRFFPDFSSREFKYLLSPARSWGNGIAKHIEIVMDLSDLLKKGFKINELEFPGKSVSNGIYQFSSDNFNFNKTKDIHLSYDGTIAFQSQFVAKHRLQKVAIASIKASSTLHDGKYDYSADNLIDGNPSTAWVEGVKGDGINEWIEIELKKSTQIGYIGIINGFYGSKNLYLANSRIKKLKIEFLNELEPDQSGPGPYEKEVILDNKQYMDYDPDNLMKMLDTLYVAEDSARSAKKIRLTILEAYPGKSFSDNCISEIYISDGAY